MRSSLFVLSFVVGCLPPSKTDTPSEPVMPVTNEVAFGGMPMGGADVNLSFAGVPADDVPDSAGESADVERPMSGGSPMSAPMSEASDDTCYACGDGPGEVLRCGEDDGTRFIMSDRVCAVADSIRPCIEPEMCCPDDARFEDGECRCNGDSEGPECTVPNPQPTIDLATFNVKLFFDDQCQSMNCANGFEDAPSTSIFQAKAKQLARAIEALEIDGVCLQEIENQRALDALTAEFEDDRLNVSVIRTVNDGGGIDVAFIGRGELLKVTQHRDRLSHTFSNGETAGFAREFLQVDFNVDGIDVIMFCAHFIAKSGNAERFWRDPYRRAEAGAARDIMLEVAAQHPDALLVLGGDLNDFPGSTTLNVFEDDERFKRVAAELNGAERTHRFGALDHLYIVTDAGGVYVDGSVEVVRSGERGYAGSDHAALKASFRGQ